MEEIFATKIKINDVLNIRDFEIPLSEAERRHLIITGKNGSGKTTVLREIKKYLLNVINDFYDQHDQSLKILTNQVGHDPMFTPNLSNLDRQNISNSINDVQKWINENRKIIISFNNRHITTSKKYSDGDFIISFFEAKRNSVLIPPTGISKINIKPFYTIDDKAGENFIQYIVNLKADKSFAHDDNEIEEANKIDEWFTKFEENILEIFDAKGAQLVFDRKNYNFNIVELGKEPYNLNQLSDGYSSILNIVSELIMRMEEHKTKNYDVQGIVLIDEIETHLHIDLQKKILPFLTSFFPKIQFIVTTHSPFVITSIKNAVVCDLEKKIVLDNLSGYSYDAIVEGYFDADKYSTVLKQQVEEYETLMSKDGLTEKEDLRLQELKKYLDGIPKFLSDELTVKLQQIRLKNLNRKTQK